MSKVALVIPVKNESSNITRLLSSILRQTLRPDEVLIVDGGSTDNTIELIKNFTTERGMAIKLIETRKAYPGEGRNIGVQNSTSDFIAFTDAGIELDDKWFEEITRPIRENARVDVVYGSYEPAIVSFLNECSLIAYVPAKKCVNGRVFRTDFIASSLFRRRVFLDAGGFPPFRAAEDRIFMEEVKAKALKTVYNDKALVKWEIPSTVVGIFKRFSEFSIHDIVAGRMKDWHYSVIRTYVLLLLFLISGLCANYLFFLGILFVWCLRLTRLYLRKRADLKPKYIFDPRYLLGVNLVLMVTDMAMFTGIIRLFAGAYEKNK